MTLFSSSVSLFIFSPDNLSIGESRVFKSSTVAKFELIWAVEPFYDIGCAKVWFVLV